MPSIPSVVTDIAARKGALRAAALARRDAMPGEARAAASLAIADAALPLAMAAIDEGFAPVSVFLSIRSEIDTGPLIARLSAAGAPLCLPVVTPAGLVFRAWRPGAPLVAARFGLREPPADAPEIRPRLLIVPLAVFDRRGGRIGYGKGYYDGALARLSATHAIRTLGLAFACQETAEAPMEAHDRRLDAIVTENGVARSGPVG